MIPAPSRGPFRLLVDQRPVLQALVSAEIRHRYAASVLGLAWLTLYPLLFLALYAGVYLAILKVRAPDLSSWGYVLTVFCGLVPYIGFSEAVQHGSSSLSAHRGILRNSLFPAELLPVRAVLCSQVVHAAALAVLLVLCAASGRLSAYAVTVPLVFVAQYLLVQGLAWGLSVVTLAVRDAQYVVGLGLLFLLFLSPVGFTPEMAPDGLRPWLRANPLYYPIALYRGALLDPSGFRWTDLAVLVTMGTGTFFAGFAFFRKSQELVAEHA